MNRGEVREKMMQLVFQMEARNEFTQKIKKEHFKHFEGWMNQRDYINEVFQNIKEHKDEIDEMIEKSSDNWKIQRMAKVDLAILRVATCEIMYMSGIPTSVSINEAVNLGKKYGTDESGKFINGILGVIAKSDYEKPIEEEKITEES